MRANIGTTDTTKKSLLGIGKRVIASSKYYYIFPCHDEKPAKLASQI